MSEHIEILGECNQIFKHIDESLDRIENKVCTHIYDGEKEGGFRDKLLTAILDIDRIKTELSLIKKGYYISGALGGVIGGLVGKVSPDIISFLVGLIK